MFASLRIFKLVLLDLWTEWVTEPPHGEYEEH